MEDDDAGNDECEDEAEDGQEQPEGELDDGEEPQTRAAFSILRSSYDSDADFVHDLFQQPLLQKKLRLITYDLGDLHAEYVTGLKAGSQHDTMKACAGRSAYSWFATVQAMAQRLGSTGLVEELQMYPRVPQPGARALRTSLSRTTWHSWNATSPWSSS